jgi:hypothetical protein
MTIKAPRFLFMITSDLRPYRRAIAQTNQNSSICLPGRSWSYSIAESGRFRGSGASARSPRPARSSSSRGKYPHNGHIRL